MEPESTSTRPVSTYFAPAVRVRRLSDTLTAGTEAGDDLPADVLGDLLSAEVTLLNTGSSQYSLTFNNWYTTTATDRAGSDRPGARELTSEGRPLWPRFKYNDFSLLAFGQRLRVDMRYWPDPSAGGGSDSAAGLDAVARAAQKWTPMVSGPVTDMRFEFTPSSGARVTVRGEDDLSQLLDRRRARKEFDKKAERRIVEEVLNEAHYPLNTIAPPRVDWPPFADVGPGAAQAMQEGQSYLEFLQKLADKLDFEVFVQYADLNDPSSAIEFHFEPSRSRASPDAAEVFVLHRDKNLIEFSPTLKVVSQPSEVTVKGRHRDRGNPTRVEQTVRPSVLSDELHGDPSGKGPPLVPGPAVRAHYFPSRSNPDVLSNEPNTDPDRADWLAQVEMRRKAREFLTIEGTTIGLPRLRPGNYVEIRGMRPPFDGFYYVSKAVHSYGGEGLRTKFSARRPGMPLPPYGET